jgi:FkbM family methyltransferase
MHLDRRSAYERDLYFRACEPDTYPFIRSFLKPGMTVVDCGANLGFYTLLSAVRVGPSGRVFSFEPTPNVFARLNEHVRSNGFTNVKAHQVALAESPGEAHLWQMRAINHGMNTLIDGYHNGVDLGPCAVTTLDLSLAGIEADLVKIDVEGSELRVLRGASQVIARATLVIELSRPTMRPFGYAPEDLVRYLREQRGYDVYWLHGRAPVHVRPDAELPHYRVLGAEHGANYVFRPIRS